MNDPTTDESRLVASSVNPKQGVSPPPPLGPTPASTQTGAAPARLADFERAYRPLDGGSGLLRIVDAILKTPAGVVHELVHGRARLVSAVLLLVTVACLLIYGLIMGLFAGGHQLWAVPVRVAAGMLVAGLICLPSLYIFTSIAGGRQTLGQTQGVLLLAMALNAILMVGFAPVAWVFSQATNTSVFMGGLHLVFWIVSVLFALRLLGLAFRFLNGRRLGILALWHAVFVAVVLQMSTTLRPLVGHYDGLRLQEKKFFITHWSESLEKP